MISDRDAATNNAQTYATNLVYELAKEDETKKVGRPAKAE